MRGSEGSRQAQPTPGRRATTSVSSPAAEQEGGSPKTASGRHALQTVEIWDDYRLSVCSCKDQQPTDWTDTKRVALRCVQGLLKATNATRSDGTTGRREARSTDNTQQPADGAAADPSGSEHISRSKSKADPSRSELLAPTPSRQLDVLDRYCSEGEGPP